MPKRKRAEPEEDIVLAEDDCEDEDEQKELDELIRDELENHADFVVSDDATITDSDYEPSETESVRTNTTEEDESEVEEEACKNKAVILMLRKLQAELTETKRLLKEQQQSLSRTPFEETLSAKSSKRN
jgi:hypothetical protein